MNLLKFVIYHSDYSIDYQTQMNKPCANLCYQAHIWLNRVLGIMVLYGF